MTAPVKKLEEVIASVRHGSFLPHSSRSNRFPSTSSKDDKRDKDARDSTDVVVPTASETGGSSSQQMGSNAEVRVDAHSLSVDETVEVDSDSSTSSSSSDDAPDDEVAELCMSQSPLQSQLEKFHWKEHCTIYKHARAHKLHLQAMGSETGTFLCGRMISDDYKKFSGTIA